MLTNLLQPQIHASLIALSPSLAPLNQDVPLTALPSPGIPLAVGITSHLLTHLLLSPMEVIRTRLIVMPLSHASTPSSVGLFRQMIEEEGGFSNLYLNAGLLIPTVLEHTIRPLLTLSIPLLLERQLGISPELSPITYSMCDLGLGLASLVVLLPIETVRKRLQLQQRGAARGKKMKTIVKVREREYVGVVEAIWRIVTEETGVRRKRHMSERDEGGMFAGIRQLYRGVSLVSGRPTRRRRAACQFGFTHGQALTIVRHGGDGASDGFWAGAGQCGIGRERRWRLEGDLSACRMHSPRLRARASLKQITIRGAP
jgi:fusion and transport protein UGO1